MPRISKLATIKNVRAWQNRRKSLLYWAFYRRSWWKASSQQYNFRPSIRCGEIGWA